MTILEFKKLSKIKMQVTITEIMVMQGWELDRWLYNFRSYNKEELVKKYEEHLTQEIQTK